MLKFWVRFVYLIILCDLLFLQSDLRQFISSSFIFEGKKNWDNNNVSWFLGVKRFLIKILMLTVSYCYWELFWIRILGADIISMTQHFLNVPLLLLRGRIIISLTRRTFFGIFEGIYFFKFLKQFINNSPTHKANKDFSLSFLHEVNSKSREESLWAKLKESRYWNYPINNNVSNCNET